MVFRAQNIAPLQWMYPYPLRFKLMVFLGLIDDSAWDYCVDGAGVTFGLFANNRRSDG